MFRKILNLTTLFALMFPASLLAETSPLYISLNSATFDSKYHDYEVDGAILSLGIDLNNYISFEVSGGTSDKHEDTAAGISYEVDYVASAFMKLNLRLNRVNLYVLGGYTKSEVTSTVGTTTTTDETKGGSVGYGIDFFGTPDLALSIRRVEFYDLENEPKTHLGATMFGITYYFDTPRIHSRY